MTTEELFDLNRKLKISNALIEAIKTFPTVVVTQHCEASFEVSPFDIYATCPTCGVKFKLRSFSALAEIQDVLDAVFEWLLKPEAEAILRQRQNQILADQ